MQDFENAGRFAPWPIQIFSAGTQTTGDLAAAIDDLGMGVWMCDPASDRFSPPEWLWRLAGIKPVIPTLSAFVAALHPDDRDHLVAAFDHAGTEGSTLQVEVRMDRPDQSARWVQLKGRAISPKRGSLRILGVVSDVTAIKLQQRQLLRLQAEISSLTENSPDVMVRFDAAGKILHASTAFLNRMKAESEVSALLHHLRQVAAKALTTRSRQQQACCIEVAGKFQWLETRAITETDSAGRVSVLTFTRDVTERRISEELLESSRRSLMVALESVELAHDAANMGYWEWDLAADRVRWSDRIFGLFGLSPASVTPSYETWISRVHPDDRKACEAALEQIYGPTGKYHCQYRVVRDDGSVRWIEGHGKLIRDVTGSPARMIGTVSDITEQKSQEAALVHFEKLSSTMRLSSTLAHEINNPLTAVTYLLHLAQQDDTLATATRSHLTAAQEELARAVHVASQTLSLYRTPSGKTAVDAGSMVQDLLRIYRHRLRSRRVETVTRLENSAKAWASAGELRQIVSNLLVNGMDAAGVGRRRLYIRVRTIRSPRAATPGTVQISIADEGPGIESSLRKRLFQPFFTTHVSHGIGLGLWLTRELVVRNSGSIRMRSCTTQGSSWTVFMLRFPAAQPQPQGEPRVEAAAKAA